MKVKKYSMQDPVRLEHWVKPKEHHADYGLPDDNKTKIIQKWVHWDPTSHKNEVLPNCPNPEKKLTIQV